MRAFKKTNSVVLNSADIADFCAQWPCSGLFNLKGVTFEFDGNELCNITYKNGKSEDYDGPALKALSEDALNYFWAVTDKDTLSELRKEYKRYGSFPWWWIWKK
jgi:hypothetical protein